MKILGRLLKRLATPEDRKRLEQDPRFALRLRVIARISLRYFWVYAIVLVLSFVVVVASFMDIYHRTEMPQFCGACHEMTFNFLSWKESVHKSIRCVDCHSRPGFGGWLNSKFSGMRQLVQHFGAESIEDIRMTEEQNKVVSENCKRCHAGATRLQERRGIVIAHGHHLQMGILCVACHSRRFVHQEMSEEDAPAAPADEPSPLADFRDCFACHDGKSTFGSATAFNFAEEKSCGRCHPDAAIGNDHGDSDSACGDCHRRVEGDHYGYSEDRIGTEICSQCHDVEMTFPSAHSAFRDGRCLECHSVMYPSHLYLTGSKPEVAMCLSCHEGLARVLAEDATAGTSGFAEVDMDLHQLHREALEGDGVWCLKCHGAHGGSGSKALLQLPGGRKDFYEATPRGGTCYSSCHGDDMMEYSREDK